MRTRIVAIMLLLSLSPVVALAQATNAPTTAPAADADLLRQFTPLIARGSTDEEFTHLEELLPKTRGTSVEGPLLLRMAQLKYDKPDQAIPLLNQALAIKGAVSLHHPVSMRGGMSETDQLIGQQIDEHFAKHPTPLEDEASVRLAQMLFGRDDGKAKQLLQGLEKKYPKGHFVAEDAAAFAAFEQQAAVRNPQAVAIHRGSYIREEFTDYELTRPDLDAALTLHIQGNRLPGFMTDDERLANVDRILRVYGQALVSYQTLEVCTTASRLIAALPPEKATKYADLQKLARETADRVTKEVAARPKPQIDPQP